MSSYNLCASLPQEENDAAYGGGGRVGENGDSARASLGRGGGQPAGSKLQAFGHFVGLDHGKGVGSS